MDLKYLATKWDEKEILSTLSNEKKCHDTCISIIIITDDDRIFKDICTHFIHDSLHDLNLPNYHKLF